MFRKRTPAEKLERAIIRLIARDLRRRAPQLIVRSWETRHSDQTFNIELNKVLAKYLMREASFTPWEPIQDERPHTQIEVED